MRHVVHVTRPDATNEGPESLKHCRFVTSTKFSCGVIGVGEFGRCVNLRTAAIAIATDPLADPVEQGHELAHRIARNGIDHLVPLRPKLAVLALEEGCDQIILRVKVTIHAGLRHSGLRDDPFDADRPDAVCVEQTRCRCEYARCGIEFIGRKNLQGDASGE